MSALPVLRAMALAGGALAALSLAGRAWAQDASPTANPTAISSENGAINLTAGNGDAPFAQSDPEDPGPGASPQTMQLRLSVGHAQTGAPVDVSFTHRGVISVDDTQQGHGSEVRVGRGLVATDQAHSDHPSVYAFVSSDDQALTWRPGQRSEFGGQGHSLAVENQVQIGDHAAGVAYEHNGVQASLAYVERKESTRVGQQRFSQDQSFAGVTVTVRH